jgi:acyl carrier protein
MMNAEKDISIAERLLFLASRRSGIESLDIASETPLQELGIDSLGFAELMFDIDDEFGIEITDEDMLQIKLVGELVTHIESKVAAKKRAA